MSFTTAWKAKQNREPVPTHPFLCNKNLHSEILLFKILLVKCNARFIILDKISTASVVVKLQL